MKHSSPVLLATTLSLSLVLASACSGHDQPPSYDPADGNSGGTSAGGTDGMAGGTQSGGQGGAASAAGGSEASGGSGVGGSLRPPTSCDGVVCVRGTCDDSTGYATCECDDGFESDGARCEDINECVGDHGCDNGFCRNTYGSYYCECSPGFIWDGGACSDIDECADGACHSDASCQNENGDYTCSCAVGSFGDGLHCNSSDTCQGDPCQGNGECVVTSTGNVCICDSGFEGTSTCSSCSTLQLDPAIEGLVRIIIDKPTGDLVPVDVKDISFLDISDLGVQTLDGMECWPGLQSLSAGHNDDLGVQPGDLTALSKLNALTYLDLGCTGVTRLDDLSGHARLETLLINSLSCEPTLVDASGLSGLTSLKQLSIVNQQLNSDSFLSGLTSLETIDLSVNKFASLGALSGLSLLRSIIVSGNELTALPDLSGLTSLTALDVGYNQIASRGGFTDASQLMSLNLSNNPLAGLPPLQSLQSLRTLDASSIGLWYASLPARLSQVHVLSVADNNVGDLTPFIEEDFRGTLRISGNPLPCSTEQEKIAELRSQGVLVQGSCE